MVHTIHNPFLSVSVSEHGAQLQSIVGKSGTEYLWQGDPQYWSDRDLHLFPYVARLTEGKYMLDGHVHQMAIHGIAPYRRFQLVAGADSWLTLELLSDEQTLEAYPRHFSFRVGYTLEDDRLNVTYEIENRDEKTMYFGLGGHPGFCVPLESGKTFEDYRLRFGAPCQPVRVGFSEDCFVTDDDHPFHLEQDLLLPLRHTLFDDDAIVLKNMTREVTLECSGSSRSVTVTFPQMQYVGLWHMPKTDAPYLCIEPWCSLPSHKDQIAVFEEQKDLITLMPGGVYRNTWSIHIHNP